jgi:replicative DNA helicase
MGDLMERIDHAFAHRASPAEAAGGIATGFFGLDLMTGGLKPQELWIVGARTSTGKTSFLLNVACTAALKGNIVAIFSMEMSARSIANRIGAAIAGISVQRVKDGRLERVDLEHVTEKLAPFMKKNAGIWVDDSSALELADFKARARRMATAYKVNLIVVDYLQLMVSAGPHAKNLRALEVTEIAQCLKNIAKELNIPVMAAAQLNRNPKDRKFGFPKLTDLRESGDIENSADLCLLLWRPWAEIDRKDPDERAALAKKLNIKNADNVTQRDQMSEAYARLIIAKQRDGPPGDIPLRFDGDRTRFHSVKETAEPDEEDTK